jgi:hypothetical protein
LWGICGLLRGLFGVLRGLFGVLRGVFGVLRGIFGVLRGIFRVLREIFGAKRDEVTGEWRKLHEELNDLYCSPNIVRVIKSIRKRWAGYVLRMGEGRGVQRVLVGKPEGKRPHGRPRSRWVYNIKEDL